MCKIQRKKTFWTDQYKESEIDPRNAIKQNEFTT